MKLIAGWLLANGIALANAESPSESEIVSSLQRHYSTKTGEIVALANDKTSLTGKITALENDKSALTTQVNEKTTALANALTVGKAERKGRAEAIADLAIARGKISVAERDANVTALCNASDETAFDAAAKSLLDSATKHRIGGQVDVRSGKALANDDAAGARAEYDEHFKDALMKTGQDPIKAHAMVMKLPGLAEKFAVKRAGA